MAVAQTLLKGLGSASPVRGGYVTAVRGILAEASGIEVPVGGLVEIEAQGEFLPAEAVGFRGDSVQLMPLVPTRGIGAGCRVWPLADRASVPAGDFLLGRVVDAMGEPIDAGPSFSSTDRVPLYTDPISPLSRPPLSEPLDVGVRSINSMLTMARGQRLGLFSSAGVGKSTLLGMMLRGTDADIRVIALIGERGREVREFIDREIAGARQSTVVVAVPSDSSPLLRTRGAYVATAIAEFFRDRGGNVLLLMDSITRFAFAAREIGLARGEPTTTKGYTPSVFAELPLLIERTGRLEHGSITAVYAVLVEGDDMDDPVADALRGLLDGHIVLSRALSERGQYPAIDVLASISRAMTQIVAPEHRERATRLRQLLAAYRDAEDLIQVGAYAAGSDATIDEAISRRPGIESFLRQAMDEVSTLPAAVLELDRVLTETVS